MNVTRDDREVETAAHMSFSGETLLSPAGAALAVPGYEIGELIGRGGMGDVYWARDLEMDREVAVKILQDRYPVDSPTGERFVEEARVTGQLQHPGIPAVYRVSKLSDGRPFLAMKLIKGETLDDLLKGNGPVNHLAVMEAVAQAVGYAHAHEVIHRDLKPQNIMVGAFGEVQVMDWGLSKVLASGGRQPPATEADLEATTAGTLIRGPRDSEQTQAGSVLGTPAYMPPEQAAGETDRVGKSSDVFGLGAVWCKLLTGEAPFTGADPDSIRRNALRGKTEEALARLDGCAAEPDVVALCKRCLAVEPEDRPRDANEVAAAVAALRVAAEDRAKQAELSRARAEVQAAEQVKRRQVVQRAAIIVATVLLLGVVGTGLGLWNADVARRNAHASEKDADEKRKTAEEETALANAVKAFLQYDVLQLADPATQQQDSVGLPYDADVRLRDVVLRAAEKFEGKFQERPLVEAEIRHTLGFTLMGMGRYDLGAKQFERAQELRRAELGPDDPTRLMSMNNLATCYNSLGQHAEALKLFEETLALRKAKLGPDHPRTLMSMSNLANCYDTVGRHAEAHKIHEETLALRKAKLGSEHRSTLMSMYNLSASYSGMGRHAEALKLREETLAMRKAKFGADHPDTLTSMMGLASSYLALGRHAQAHKLYGETLALRKSRLGPDHPETLSSMTDLAGSFYALSRYGEALKLYEETLALHKAKFGANHPATLRSALGLASAYAILGRHAEALKLQEETLALRRARFGSDHPDSLSSMADLAGSVYALGRHAEALKLYEEALALHRAALGPAHPNALRSMWGVASSLIALDRAVEAVPIIDECLRRSAGRAGVHPQMVPAMANLRLRHFQKAGDPAGCRATAEMWEKLDRKDVASLYDAACNRAVTAEVLAKTKGSKTDRLVKEDADRAMDWLTKAVAAGYNDRAHIEADSDLDFLRKREDFKKLIAGLPKERK